MMKKIILLLMVALMASCASRDNLSLSAKYDLESTPIMNREQIAFLVIGTIGKSDLPDEEKKEILKGLNVYVNDLVNLELETRRIYGALLKNLGQEEKKSQKTYRQLTSRLNKVDKKRMKVRKDMLKYLSDNLKGKIHKNVQEELIEILMSGDVPGQMEQVPTDMQI